MGNLIMLTLIAYHYNLSALPNLVVALAVLLLGILLRVRESDATTGTWALGMSIAIAVWQAGFAAAYMSQTPMLALQWIAVSQTGVIFIAPTLYELLRRLLGLTGWRNRLSPWFWAASFGFLYVLLFTNAYLAAPYRYAWGYYAHYRIGGTLLAVYLSAVLVFVFLECWRTWRWSPHGTRRRHRARILVVGFGVAFTAAIDFLPAWGVALYPFGYLMVAFMVITVGYAAWRYRVVTVTSQTAADHVLKTLSDGVLVADELGAVALVNHRAAVLLGGDRNQIMGRRVDEIIPELEPVFTPDSTQFPGPVRAEIELPMRAGKKRVVNVTINMMSDAHGDAPLTVYVLQDVTHYREATERIRELVYFDQATGLPNRRYFCDQLSQALRRSSQGQSVAVCGIRVEHVRHVVDHGAPHSSDSVLAEIATRLKSFARSAPQGNVTAARLQGDEFALLLEGAGSLGKITAALNRLHKELKDPIGRGTSHLYPILWFGVSLYPDDGHNVNALLDRATAAMDQAADEGTEHVHFYNAEVNTAALHALTLSTRLARAIEHNELCLYFQPIVSANSGTIECGEALVRWNDPLHGLRMPDEFISIAEQSGLIATLDQWVLKNACTHALQWSTSSSSGARVAVNLSGSHLASSDGARIAELVEDALEMSGFPPDRLDIEITETGMIGTSYAMVDSLRHLRGLGVRIAIDDFGTGYASLSYLQWFPLDKLKMDQSFVMAIGQDPTKTALLESSLLLASQLGLDVVAEGVETPHQAAFLRRHGCAYMQGLLFSGPLPADDFVHLAETWRVPAELRFGGQGPRNREGGDSSTSSTS